jgi:purine-binding chemotaxis protein CheW
MPELNSLDPTQHLTFQIAGEEYAVGILSVKEIITYGALTTVPQTPPFIRGVINLRGSVVPVVDLAVKLGLPPTPITHRTCIVILEVNLHGEQTVMGMMADSVSQVIELSPAEISPAPPLGARVNIDYLLGLAESGSKFILLLDIEKILATMERIDSESRAGGHPGITPATTG